MRTPAFLLCVFLVLGCLAPQAAPGAAFYSTESCLDAGLKQCRDAEGGAGGRSACLKAFLAACAFDCPTLDADCAVQQLENAPLETWRVEWTGILVGEACRVLAQCAPPDRLPDIPEP